MCSNYHGITLLSFPAKAYAKVLKRWLRSRRSNVDSVLLLGCWTSSSPLQGFWKGPGSLPIQSTCVEKVYNHVFAWLWGTRAVATEHPVLIISEWGLCPDSRQEIKHIFQLILAFVRIVTGYRFSRRSKGKVSVWFGDLRIASLLFAHDVVLLALSDCLQHAWGGLQLSVKWLVQESELQLWGHGSLLKNAGLNTFLCLKNVKISVQVWIMLDWVFLECWHSYLWLYF